MALYQSTFTSMDSNNKKLGFILFCYDSLLVYCTTDSSLKSSVPETIFAEPSHKKNETRKKVGSYIISDIISPNSGRQWL